MASEGTLMRKQEEGKKSSEDHHQTKRNGAPCLGRNLNLSNNPSC